MSQRVSGYARKERDLYETPEWVTDALVSHLPRIVATVWEPACGSGKMVRALQKTGAYVLGTDLQFGEDFLRFDLPVGSCWDAIITNPPYECAADFIGHALALMERPQGMVAMLLRTDFDHAATRHKLFGGCPTFARKLVLIRRIKWFEGTTGQPSFNHAWFIWDWKHRGPPILAYGPYVAPRLRSSGSPLQFDSDGVVKEEERVEQP